MLKNKELCGVPIRDMDGTVSRVETPPKSDSCVKNTCDEDQEAFEEYAAIMQYDGGMTREEAETQAREVKMLDDLLNLPPFDLKDLPEPALDDLLKDLLILPELPELPPFV